MPLLPLYVHRHRRDDTHTHMRAHPHLHSHTHTHLSADELMFPHKGIYRTEERLTGQYMDPYLESYQNRFRSKTMELEAAALAKGAGERRSWCRLLLSRNLFIHLQGSTKSRESFGKKIRRRALEALHIKPKGTSAKSKDVKTKEVRTGAISARGVGHLRKVHFAEHGLQKLQQQISSSNSSFLSDVHQSPRRGGSHSNLRGVVN